MRLFRLLFFISIAGIFFTSCTPKETNDIYLCGNSSDYRAFYWVNGQKTELSPDCYKAQVNAMEVLDGDVYCAGHIREHEGGSDIAVYWKNGEVRKITDGSCNANVLDMYVNYKVICCVGGEADGPKKKMPRRQYSFDYDIVRHDRAKAWFIYDWGTTDELVLTKGEYHGFVNSIYVDSTNRVHLAGYDEGISGRLIGTIDAYTESRYWQLEGKTWTLDSEERVFKHCGRATAVFGSGTDVYVCGWNDDDLQSSGGFDALYWKDGWSKNLPDDDEVTIEDGCVNGPDWYMCGYKYSDDPRAIYYKNGQAVELFEYGSQIQSAIHAISVAGNDVYMAGYRGNQPGYWKNDRFVPLEGFFGGELTGIVVRESWDEKK